MATYVYARDLRREPFARKLARRLGIRCVDTSTAPRRRTGNALICWGNSTPPAWLHRTDFWLANRPEEVAVASHKTRALSRLIDHDVPTLEYTTSRNVALDWFRQGARIYARTKVQGHSGDGLVFLDPADNTEANVVQAPLYTKDFRTPFKEYRVHVAFGRVIDITQKKRLSEEEILARGLILPANRIRLQVRTYGNGWAFTRHDVRDHNSIHELALSAARAINNMAIAVVDIAAEWRGGVPVRSAVIEINTAPALRSDTLLGKYIQALRPHLNKTEPVEY
jgi:hypothetical protein